MEEKFENCLLLHALGDTLGFKNGDWEFNYRLLSQASFLPAFSAEHLYEFLELGGIQGINLKGWRVSDDTVLHLATAAALLQTYKNIPALLELLKKEYLASLMDMEERYPGNTTLRSLAYLKKNPKSLAVSYDFKKGGSGASMRTLCIGLAYAGKKQRGQLIAIALEASRLTHNSATGYLGGITAALFTAFALEGKPPESWPFRLVSLLEEGIIEKYLGETRELEEYNRDKYAFIDKWKLYIGERFSKDKKFSFNKAMRDPVFRTEYYHETYSDKRFSYFPGSAGDDSVIIAYDSLMDSQGHWEKLVVYSMLHAGDSDTTGCIAGGWYGIVYGLKDVPSKNLEHLEYKDRLKETARKLYSKFSKGT